MDKILANDGTDWRSTASPVSTEELRKADKAIDDEARKGDGPSATNETYLARSVAEGSEEEPNP